MKEHLVTQLKTQISDLERFIEFLQGTNILCGTLLLIASACVSNFTLRCALCTVLCVLVLLWCTGSEHRNFVDDSGLVAWYTLSLVGGFWCFEGHWLCLSTTALFPMLAVLHGLLDSEDEHTAVLWNIITTHPLTRSHDVTSHKTWIFSSTSVRTSNLTATVLHCVTDHSS